MHRDVHDLLLERIRHHAAEWPVGDPLDPQTRLGALVSPAHFRKVCGYLEQAYKVVLGGQANDGFVDATVVSIPDNTHPLAREEIFGPVLSVIKVASFEEAIAIANDTPYGLAASIFTANAKRAIRGARMLQAGTVSVNAYGEGDASTPFGGFKQSGFGGRDKSLWAHDQYTQLKTIWIALSDDTVEAVD